MELAASDDRRRRLRTQAKVAGVLMMLFGAFCAFQFATLAYAAPHFPDQNKERPGGNLSISFPAAPHANVTLVYASGAPSTNGTLDGSGNGAFTATNATFDVSIQSAGKTWTRSAFVPAGFAQSLSLDADAPPSTRETLGLPNALLVTLWAIAAAAVVVTAGGYFAFKLRAPRVAMAGAFLFVMGAALLLSQVGVGLLGVSFVGTAILCFAFIYRARTEFSPFRGPAAPPTPPASPPPPPAPPAPPA